MRSYDPYFNEYPSGAIDVMLEHRYAGLGADTMRPLTPESSSAMEYGRSNSREIKGASSAMLEHRYAGLSW